MFFEPSLHLLYSVFKEIIWNMGKVFHIEMFITVLFIIV